MKETCRMRRFVVLVPHRDYRRIMREYRARLFAAGLAGAYSFPEMAPFALTERPWTREELKAAARSLRSKAGAGGFQTGPGRFIVCPGGPLLWGPALNFSCPDTPFSLPPGSRRLFSPTLCAALIRPDAGLNAEDAEKNVLDALPPPVFSFQAAALANLIWKPLERGDPDYSFTWQTGELCWLPSRRGEPSHRG
ncbi:MAG: hypothetical protein LBG76_02860 [Treponema sp.]|nr:hypothetical protein [Treponema sp.]